MKMPLVFAALFLPAALRKGIDGLATIIGDKYGQNPFEKGTLFLFCGKRSDRCKGLLWMGTGFLLLYKRFEAGRLSWPRNIQEAADLTEEQYKYLMMGLNPLDPKIIMDDRIRTIRSSAIRQERCNCTLKTLYFQRLIYES